MKKYSAKIKIILLLALSLSLSSDTPQIQSSFELAFKYDLKAIGTIKNSKGIPRPRQRKKELKTTI